MSVKTHSSNKRNVNPIPIVLEVVKPFTFDSQALPHYNINEKNYTRES